MTSLVRGMQYVFYCSPPLNGQFRAGHYQCAHCQLSLLLKLRLDKPGTAGHLSSHIRLVMRPIHMQDQESSASALGVLCEAKRITAPVEHNAAPLNCCECNGRLTAKATLANEC